MKVYVVCWLQSHDGRIFKEVFGSREKAEEYVDKQSPTPSHKQWYDIEEYEV